MTIRTIFGRAEGGAIGLDASPQPLTKKRTMNGSIQMRILFMLPLQYPRIAGSLLVSFQPGLHLREALLIDGYVGEVVELVRVLLEIV